VIGFDGSGFVRLLSATEEGLLAREQTLMEGETESRAMDLVEVEAPWADVRPGREEGRIVSDRRWRLVERPAGMRWLEDLERMPVAEGPLFGGPERSTSETWDGPSIRWVEPEGTTAVCRWDEARERYTPRLRFTTGGLTYELPLTDCVTGDRLRHLGEGEFPLAALGWRAPHGLRLVVTLGEAFRGHRYKMVAGIWRRRTVTLWRYGTTSTLSLPRGGTAHHSLEYAGPDLGCA
jgi:hypothetical protein